MKKTFSVVIGLFILLILPAVSFSAAPRPYISGQLGVAFLSDSDFTEPGYYTETLDFDPGFATTFAGGVNFGMFRVEGEIGYQTNEIDRVRGGGYSYNANADLYCLSFLANGYIDFVNKSPFTPYISAGIGIANVGVKSDYYYDHHNDRYYYYDDDDTVFAYQVGAGVAYSINKNMILDLKYRFFATEDPNLYGSKAEFKSHNIYFGFRYTF
ncbi:MAG TPA: outer membrane beta-barrel protein [Smithellaceae bacterium]|nr:outer membrane beta-barrel protein [Smithellaceae bacterium]